MLIEVIHQGKDFIAIMDAAIPLEQKVTLILGERYSDNFSELFHLLSVEIPDSGDEDYDESVDEKFLTYIYEQVTLYIPEWERIVGVDDE